MKKRKKILLETCNPAILSHHSLFLVWSGRNPHPGAGLEHPHPLAQPSFPTPCDSVEVSGSPRPHACPILNPPLQAGVPLGEGLVGSADVSVRDCQGQDTDPGSPLDPQDNYTLC